MSRLTRDGTAEPVSRDQILRHARGQGNIIFPVQLTTSRIGNYPVDLYSAVCDDHTYIHTYRVSSDNHIKRRSNFLAFGIFQAMCSNCRRERPVDKLR